MGLRSFHLSVGGQALAASIAWHTPAFTLAAEPAPWPAELSIAATSAVKDEGDSGTTAYTFTVTRTGNPVIACSASWAVTGSGGDPANAADFGGALPSGTVTFATGETSKLITVNVAGDGTDEADEGFTVTLSAPVNCTIGTATATGTIQNDDTPFFASAQFPQENGLSTDSAANGEFRLPGSNTGNMSAAGAGALWYGAASLVAFVDPAHEREDALNYNATIIGNVSAAETGVRGFRLAYYTGWNATSARRRTFRFYIRGETAASAAWVPVSAQLPYTAKGPFAVLVYNDGSNAYCHVYDIPTATWHDGSAVGKPSGWAGVTQMTSALGIGGEYTGTFPKDNSANYAASVHFRGALGDILFANAALSKADVEALVEGAAPVATATGAGATAYLHIPLVDGAGALDLSVDTTYTNMGSGLTQNGTIYPGPTIRRQDASDYLTLDRLNWPQLFGRESGETTATAQLSGTVSSASGSLQVRQMSRDGTFVTGWQNVASSVVGTTWTADAVPIAASNEFFAVQVRFAGTPDVIASSHSACLTGPVVHLYGQSELVGAVMGTYSSSGVAGALNVQAVGRTDTVLFGVIGDNAQSPSGFVHLRHAMKRQGTIRDAAMTIANAIRRQTDEPVLLLLDAISGTSLVDLMTDSQSGRTWAQTTALGQLAGNVNGDGELVTTGDVIGGWEAFSGAVDVMQYVYKAWFTGVGEVSGSTDSTRILQSDLDNWAFDGTFSSTREQVVMPPNRTTQGSVSTTTDAGTEADQRDHFRNYADIYGFQIGPETTAHKMEGETTTLPAGVVTHAKPDDWEGYVEMAEAVAQSALMVMGEGTYPGPVFFESIEWGSAADKVVVTLGKPRPFPGDGLATGATGYSTGANATPAITYALHVKRDGGDPAAFFEASIDGGAFSKANVTSGTITDPATGEVELTLASTPVVGVSIRACPGAPGNYSNATITQDNWRAGHLFFTGAEYETGEPASGGETWKIGWPVSGSNQELALNV